MNKQTTHTPGPWGCVNTSNHAHDYRLTKPDGSPLPVNAPYNDHSEQRANTQLIAAAPELLAALEWAMSRMPSASGGNDWTENDVAQYEAACAALKKARGE